MLLDPRNGPAFDHAWTPGARTYVIASTPRTGSTLLARSLWELGLGAPKEYLNPMQLRDWEVRLGSGFSRWRHLLLRDRAVGLAGRGPWTRRRRMAHLERVRRRRTQGGWFGLKLHRHHCERFFGDESPEALLGPITWIRLTRRDRVAQAVSWDHALQTGRWVASQRPSRTARYDRRRIDRRMQALHRDEAAWEEFFTSRDVLQLTYEDLLNGQTQQVLDLLGHPGPWPGAPLVAQRDALDWVERYRTGGLPARKEG